MTCIPSFLLPPLLFEVGFSNTAPADQATWLRARLLVCHHLLYVHYLLHGPQQLEHQTSSWLPIFFIPFCRAPGMESECSPMNSFFELGQPQHLSSRSQLSEQNHCSHMWNHNSSISSEVVMLRHLATRGGSYLYTGWHGLHSVGAAS